MNKNCSFISAAKRKLDGLALFLVALVTAFWMNAAQAATTTHVWSGAGGDSLFSNPANWLSGGAPAVGATVILRFPPTGSTQAIVNVPNLAAQEISITRTPFTLGGIGDANPLFVKNVIVTNGISATFAETLPLSFTNAFNDFSAWSNTTVRLHGRMQGTNGVLRFAGWGQYVIAGTQANTYSGLAMVTSSSTVHMNKPIGVNAFAGDVVVSNGGELHWDAHQQLPDSGTRLELRDQGTGEDLYIGHSETLGTLQLTWIGGSRGFAEDDAVDLHSALLSVARLEVYEFGELLGAQITLRQAFTVTNGNTTINRMDVRVPLQLAATVSIQGNCDFGFYSPITGAAGANLRLNGRVDDFLFSPSRFEMLGTNTYAGTTYIDNGEAVLFDATGLGATNNGTVVNPGGVIRIEGGLTLNEPVMLVGATNEIEGGGFDYPEATIALDYNTPLVATLAGPIIVSNQVGLACGPSGALLNISGPVSGPGTVNVYGERLRFTGSASNSFTGGFRVWHSVVELQRTLSTQVLPGPVVIDSGVLRNMSSHQIADAATVSIWAGILDLTVYSETIANLEFHSGTNTGSGLLQVNNSITAYAVNAPAVMSGMLGVDADGVIIDVEGGGGYDPGLQINSAISGVFGGWTKTGDGRLELRGTNTYFGGTFIEGGTVTMKTPGALGGGGGTKVSNGAILEIATASNILGEYLYLEDGTLRLLSPSTNIWGGGIDLSSFGRFDSSFLTGRLVVTNTIVGGGDLVKLGAGTLEIAGAGTNVYSGNTWAAAGTLVLNKQIGSAVSGAGLLVGITPDTLSSVAATVNSLRVAQIADLTPVGLTPLGVWNLNGFSESIGALSGSGVVNLGLATLTHGARGDDSGFNGQITGTASISLVKQGAGTFTMSGVQPYIGRTTVSAGTLIVNGTNGPGLTTISGGTLGGRGQVGNVTAMGGTISPGTSPGILKIGNFIGSANLTYRCELNNTNAGTGHDQLSVTGTVNLGQSPLQLVLGNPGAISNRYTILVNDGTDPIIGTLGGIAEGATFYASGTPFRITYVGGTGNDVVITQLGLQNKPQIGAVKKLPNGNIEINGTGVPNLLYTVYASTNIVSTNWLDLGFIQATPAGALQFVDTEAQLFQQRFYQFVLPPFNQ